jgi:hypothetical protein
MRILLAGILGGIVMFIWSYVAHDLLPLGEIGVRELPNEQSVVSAMQSGIAEESGLYMFPGTGLAHGAPSKEKTEAKKRAMEKIASNPSGLLLYHATRPLNFAKLLTVEFGKEFLQAILAVFLLAQTRINGFGGRVGFVLVVGIIAAIGTNVSYWNWYGFPDNYTASYMFMEIVGFLCVGIVAALVLGRRSAA